MAKNVPARSGDSNKQDGSAKRTDTSGSEMDPAASAAPKSKLKFSFKEQREYEGIDEQIELAEQHLVDISKEMEAAFADSGKLQELVDKQKQAEAELERLMERWTYLNELAEKIAGKA